MRTTIATLPAIAAAGLLFALAGCSGSQDAPPDQPGSTDAQSRNSASGDALSDKLVGRWEGKVKPEFEANGVEIATQEMDEVTMGFEFRKDGTLTMTMPLFDIPIGGTWKPLRHEGNKLTIHTTMDMPSFSFEQSSEQSGDEEPKTTERTEMSTSKDEQELTIDFQTDDRIVVTAADDPEPMTLERKSGP